MKGFIAISAFAVAEQAVRRQNLLFQKGLSDFFTAGPIERLRKAGDRGMSMLLFIIGGVAVMIGAATIAFGVPINEFSFGNTLIVSGTTIGSAGLIVIAIAAAVAQLQRIAQGLAEQAPAARPAEALEPVPEARAVPFPPKTRPVEPREPAFEPAPPPVPAEERPSFAPALRNPEAPPPTVEEEVSLSPPFGNGTPAGLGEPRRAAGEPAFEAPWRSAPPPPREMPGTNFEAMWPSRAPRPPAAAEPAAEAKPPQPPKVEPPAPRTVAILKSGVVDGMAYTLYVDGSIEAELPQGTLRFASIDELRTYLEKKS
jgi:hypothetical protein